MKCWFYQTKTTERSLFWAKNISFKVHLSVHCSLLQHIFSSYTNQSKIVTNYREHTTHTHEISISICALTEEGKKVSMLNKLIIGYSNASVSRLSAVFLRVSINFAMEFISDSVLFGPKTKLWDAKMLFTNQKWLLKVKMVCLWQYTNTQPYKKKCFAQHRNSFYETKIT